MQNNHKVLCEKLSKYADKDGCVDKIRTKEIKNIDNVYVVLRDIAKKYNVSIDELLGKI